MAEWEIQLMPEGFNGWMDFMQHQITQAKDLLVILKAEEQKLGAVWEGGAKEQWSREFQRVILQAEKSISDMELLSVRTREAAVRLARLEQKMLGVAQGLG